MPIIAHTLGIKLVYYICLTTIDVKMYYYVNTHFRGYLENIITCIFLPFGCHMNSIFSVKKKKNIFLILGLKFFMFCRYICLFINLTELFLYTIKLTRLI